MARKISVEILGDSSSLQRAFRNANQSGSSFGRGITTGLKAAAVGVAAAFAGMAVVVKKGFDEISESQKVAAQTAAVLKSTGGIANVTAKDVDSLASSLSRMSGIDDELIGTGENLLLTFKNVRNEVGAGNDVFDRATASALNLSVAGFGSMESASKMMGKALNDPVKGMTALGRAGVTFSDEQKKAIAQMVKTGDTLGAQKKILKEVESQVGGSAKAYGETLPGQLSKLRNSFDETAGKIASTLLPAFTDAVGGVAAFVEKLGNADGASAKFKVVADEIRTRANQIWQAFTDGVKQVDWGKLATQIGTGLSGVGGKIADGISAAFDSVDWTATGEKIVAGISSALEGASDLGKKIADKVMEATRQIDWSAVGRVVGPGLATALVVAFTTLLDPGFWAKNWDLALAVAAVAFRVKIAAFAGNLLRIAVGPLTRLGGQMIDDIAEAITKFSPKLGEAFNAAVRLAVRAVTGAFAGIWAAVERTATSVWGKLPGILQKIVVVGFVMGIASAISAAAGAVASGATKLWAAAKDLAQGVIDKIREILGKVRATVTGAFAGAGGWLYGAGVAVLQGLYDGLVAKWNDVAGFLGSLKGKIQGLKGPEKADAVLLVEAGRLIMRGLQSGMEAGWMPLETWLSGRGQKLSDSVRTTIDRVVDAVKDKRAAFADAWSGYSSSALSAFDDIASKVQTRSEKLLDAMRVGREKADMQAAETDARAGLREARAGVSAAGVGVEGESAADAAARMAAAKSTLVAAQKTLDDALYRQKEYALTQQATLERTSFDEKTAVNRIRFEQWLATRSQQQIQEVTKEGKGQENILKKIGSYSPLYRSRGQELGDNLAIGLRDARGNVVDAANELAQAINNAMGVGGNAARTAANNSVNGSTERLRGAVGQVRGLAEGGIVSRPTFALIGEAGPEAVVPLRGTAALGATTQVFNFPNYVGNRDELIREVRSGLAEVGRNNPDIFAGRA